jgi:L-cystine uptake protein TcyP (sodium:dicarboxylate symporter family)
MSSRRERKAAARAVREAAVASAGRRRWPLGLRVAVALAVGIALGFALRMLAESL